MSSDNNQHEKLSKIDGMVQEPSVEDYVNDMVELHGMKVVADRLDCDISKVSRVKNGEKGFTIKEWQALMDMGDAVIIPRKEYLDLFDWGRKTFRIMEKAAAIKRGSQKNKGE